MLPERESIASVVSLNELTSQKETRDVSVGRTLLDVATVQPATVLRTPYAPKNWISRGRYPLPS